MAGMSGDDAIQATNDDVTNGKRCAVQLGYWRDPYIQAFVKNCPMERKAPEMNRGNYARTFGIKRLIDKVIKAANGSCQLINLGAGFDTLFWRLKEEGVNLQNFIELDFPAIAARKCFNIKRTKLLLQALTSGDQEVQITGHCNMHTDRYHLVGADLRQLTEVRSKLKECEIDPSIPTIILSECVLVYMEPNHSQALITEMASTFPTAVFINYEQVNMSDRFGEVMVDNLNQRGCVLAGVSLCRDLLTQQQRFTGCGWQGAKSWDMLEVYNSLPYNEISRIERIEFLDEKELLEQLFQHYCICVAYKDSLNLNFSSIDLTLPST